MVKQPHRLRAAETQGTHPTEQQAEVKEQAI